MKQDAPPPRTDVPGDDGRGPSLARREVSSEELFGDAHVVLIRHAKETYTLRRTSNGKLILTK